MAIQIKGDDLSDIIVMENDFRYTRESATLRNPEATEETLSKGLVVEVSGGKYIPLATAGNAAAVLLEDHTIAATTDVTGVAFINQGPCILNRDALDFNGATQATAEAALEALGFKFVDEPTKSTVQTDYSS